MRYQSNKQNPPEPNLMNVIASPLEAAALYPYHIPLRLLRQWECQRDLPPTFFGSFIYRNVSLTIRLDQNQTIPFRIQSRFDLIADALTYLDEFSGGKLIRWCFQSTDDTCRFLNSWKRK